METTDIRPQMPLFCGGSGRACEVFIRDVGAYAFSQGRQRDNAWMADLASTCLDGAALRWFHGLDPDVQEDWVLLRGALLQRYPPDEESEGMTTAPLAIAVPPSKSAAWSAPVAALPRALPQPPSPPATHDIREPREPLNLLRTNSPTFSMSDPPPRYTALPTLLIAAPPAPSRHLGPISPVVESNHTPFGELALRSRSASAFVGRPLVAKSSSPDRIEQAVNQGPEIAPRVGLIKIVQEGFDSKVRYVRRTMNWFGFFKCTRKITEALQVQYIPSSRPGIITMLNGPAGYTCLGITWPDAIFGPGLLSLHRAEVTAMARPLDRKLVTASKLGGKSGTVIWMVGPDEIIQATWNDGSKLEMLAVNDWLYATSTSSTQSKSGTENVKVRWVFEPF